MIKRRKGKAHTTDIKTYKKELGNRIKELRETKFKIKQTKMAELLEIPQSHVSNIENGNTFPTIYLLLLIQSKSEVRWHWLMTGKGEMFDHSREKIEKLQNSEEELEDKIKKLHQKIEYHEEVIKNQNTLIELLKSESGEAQEG